MEMKRKKNLTNSNHQFKKFETKNEWPNQVSHVFVKLNTKWRKNPSLNHRDGLAKEVNERTFVAA